MEKNKKKEIIDLEVADELKESGVSMIALVDVPAIETDWMAFRREEFVNPSKGEHEDEFIPRCIAKLVGDEGYDQTQAAAICYSTWRETHGKDMPFEMNDAFLWPDGQMFEAMGKVSFDYDDTLSTGAGLRLAQKHKEMGDELYIISARDKVSKGMLRRAEELGIPRERVFATGSNEAKVQKVMDLGINKHIDNNAEVVKKLGSAAIKFSFAAETYTDYPEGAVNNAKRALEWVDKNGWGDCGMGPGKARAHQLANREALSEDTIARMAAFERHRRNSDTPYSEGCGKLMWDAWGGDAGIRWAQSKLNKIRGEMSYDVSALPSYTDQTGKQPKKRLKFEQSDYVVNPMDASQFQAGEVTLDIPLFLRLLEIARENLNDDNQLHSLVEKASELSTEGKTLTMDDLEALTSNLPMEMQELPAPAFPSTESSAPADSGIEKLGYPSMVTLPRGHTIVVMAEGDTPPHGLLVQLMETGGYDVKYWYNNTRNIVPSQVNIDGAQVADEAMSVHLGYHGSMPYGQAFAAVEDLKVGDAVSWKTAGQNPRGRIRQIIREGKKLVPGSSFMIEGTKDNPGYIIELYEKDNGKWVPSGTMVGRKASSVVKNVELWKAQSFKSAEGVDYGAILDLARKTGKTELELKQQGFSFAKHEEGKGMNLAFAKGQTVYKYEGAIGGDSRDFCAEMVGMDRYYTFAEVAAMGDVAVNPGFGLEGANTYSIWKYKGGPNCKHRWQKYYLNENGNYENKGPAPGIAGEKPFDMPNRGYAMRTHLFAAEELDKQILVGPVAIPNIEIVRKDPDTKEKYWVKFSPEVIAKMAEKFMRESRNHETNIMHNSEDSAGTYVMESWIVENEGDKANSVYGFNLPVGSWVVKMRVQDPAVWKAVKAGKLNGFSLEGNFMDAKDYEAYKADKEIYNKVMKILQSI